MEIFLFAGVIWPEYLPYFLVLRGGSAVINGMLWGALESLRTQVRTHMRQRAPTTARAIIERWLGFGLVAVAVLVVSMLAYLRWAPTPFSSFSILDAYAISAFARLSLDVLGRIHHAGVFAYRRVYRPVWTLFVVDGLDLALAVCLFGFLGPWAFAPALLLTGVLKHILSFIYTQRAYQSLGDLAPRLNRVRPQLPSRLEVADALRYGVANLSGQFDAWVVLALATAVLTTGSDSGVALSALLHMGRPLLAAGTGWSRLFYFDFKRLDSRLSNFLRDRFDRLLYRVAWAMGGLVTAVFLLAASWLPSFRLPALVLVPLSVFVMTRSIFGLRQLQAFIDSDFRRLQWQSACGIVGLVVVAMVPTSPAVALAVLSIAMLTGVAGHASARSASQWNHGTAGSPLPLAVWLSTLQACREPLVLHVATVDRKVASPRRVARTLAASIGDTGRVALVPKCRLVWWQRLESPTHRCPDTQDDAARDPMVVAGGALVSHRSGPTVATGACAVAEAHRIGLLPPALVTLLQDTPGRRRTRAKALLAEHSDAALIDTRSGRLPVVPGVRSQALAHDVLLALTRAADGEVRTATNGLRLHVLGPDGPIVAVPRK